MSSPIIFTKISLLWAFFDAELEAGAIMASAASLIFIVRAKIGARNRARTQLPLGHEIHDSD